MSGPRGSELAEAVRSQQSEREDPVVAQDPADLPADAGDVIGEREELIGEHQVDAGVEEGQLCGVRTDERAPREQARGLLPQHVETEVDAMYAGTRETLPQGRNRRAGRGPEIDDARGA